MTRNQMMNQNGWKPVECRACNGSRDKDGRPVVIIIHMKVR